MSNRANADAVSERRLKPIYDCLDNGNNKKALQEAEKLLKKIKDFKCAKVLKSLALLRLGRQSECEVIMEEIRKTEPVDDPTLQAMTICYRELQKLDVVVDIFEKACNKEPLNEDLHSHLFMSYVRTSNYKKQQQVAMALYKLKPKKPYYLWAVMSIYMQAVENEQLAQSMLLPLAEKMVTKFISEHGIEDKNELQLQLMILEALKKYDETLELLKHPQSNLLNISSTPDYLEGQKATYLINLGRHSEAVAAFKCLINKRPEQWDYYIKYLDEVEELEKSNWQPADEGDKDLDYNLSMALEYIECRIDPGSVPTRGPHLARIEVLRRMRIKKESEEDLNLEEKLLSLLFEYYQIFGTKPGCLPDMMHLLENIPLKESTINTLLDKIYTSLGSKNDNKPTDVNQLLRHTFYYQLAQYCGFFKNLDVQSKLKLIDELLDFYFHGLNYGKELLSTDYQYSDMYSMLIVILLLEIWTETNHEQYIVKAIAHLEMTLKNSASNFHIKLVLIKLYNIIGASEATLDVHKSLDVKHIQQETLGFMFSYPLLSVGLHRIASLIIIQSLRFYSSNFKDTVDYLITGYRYGQFTKIPEIVKFKKKLSNSLYSNTILTEQMHQELLLVHDAGELSRIFESFKLELEKESIDFNALSDNKDVTCIRLWKKEDANLLKELNAKATLEEISWLKYRRLLLRSVAVANKLVRQNDGSSSPVSEMTNGIHLSSPELLLNLIGELETFLNSIDSSNLNTSWYPIMYTGPSRLLRLLKRPSNQNLILSTLKLVLYIYHGNNDDEMELKMKKGIVEEFEGLIQEINKDFLLGDMFLGLHNAKEALEDLTNLIETFNILTILANCCSICLKPNRSTSVNKKKKKAPKENGSMANFNLFIGGLKGAAKQLLTLIADVGNYLKLRQTAGLCIDNVLNLIKEEDVNLALEKINKSYEISLTELTQLTKVKVKFLQTLSC